ncbi:phosphotransferase family protein [Rhodococcus rhodochrous]|uniref:phosphotransferase family protein n=1 Tax=Rhodococcus rhodochrous TaxID=1829 RepID=UPI001E3C6D85|nr:phosphotransferase family protein [Rhodococcus rhodochrous]MCB8913427.1 phosphotransferase family protein [Rhodococcus rhodochrous]
MTDRSGQSTNLSDPRFVTRWFQHRLADLSPGASAVIATKVTRLTRGVSRQTWTVDAEVDGRPCSFVVRRDHETGTVIPTRLEDEYFVYRRLNDVPVPTARALWFEDDPEWQPDGRACFVREMIEGSWELPFINDDSPEYDELRIAHSKEHLSKLAALHTADWKAHGFDEIFAVPSTPADAAATLIQANLAVIAGFQFEPAPAVAEGVANLLATAPTDVPCVSLCKGTNGYGEEVWSDGQIVAMSDWELACLGDPAYDFAQLQDMIPTIVRDGRPLWGWPQALDYYTSLSGIPITMERVQFYRAVNGLLQFQYTHNSAAQVRNHGLRDLRFVWTGWENSFRSNIRLAQEFGFEPEGSRIA